MKDFRKANKNFKTIALFFVILLTIYSGSQTDVCRASDDEQIVSVSVSYTPIFNPDGTLILNKGSTAGRILNTSTQTMINDKDVYTCEDGDIVKNTVIYQHNMDVARGYKLLVMVDYIQTEFYVDNVKYNSYSFVLEEEDSIFIDVEIDLSGMDADEIDYIMIKDPDYNQISENEMEVSKQAHLSYISNSLLWKVRLKEASAKLDNIEFENSWEQIFEEELHLRTVTLIKDRKIDPLKSRTDYDGIIGNYFQFAREVNSGEIYSLLINNWHKEKEMEYVVFQFLDWNQIPFKDGQTLKYMKLPPESFGQYKVELPLVDTEGIYVIFAIEKPFSNISYEISTVADSSDRSIIRP